MYASVQDVDKALTQVNTVFSMLNKHIEGLEARIAELESKATARRTTTKKESDNDA